MPCWPAPSPSWSEVTGARAEVSSRLDLHHNFVQEERHLGRTVWVHRKGAIAAPAGTRVLIPGSMGTASYIAEGLGEPTSFVRIGVARRWPGHDAAGGAGTLPRGQVAARHAPGRP